MKRDDVISAHSGERGLLLMGSYQLIDPDNMLVRPHAPLAVADSIEEVFEVLEHDFHTEWPDTLLYMLMRPKMGYFYGYHPVIDSTAITMDGRFEPRYEAGHLYYDFQLTQDTPPQRIVGEDTAIPIVFHVRPVVDLLSGPVVYPQVINNEIEFYWYSSKAWNWAHASLFYGAAIHRSIPAGYRSLIKELTKGVVYGN